MKERAHDALRFFRYFKHAIERNPLQVYCSPLLFSPYRSRTRECYQYESPGWVTIAGSAVLENEWSPCLQTLEGNHWNAEMVVGHRYGWLASKPNGQSIEIFNLDTGQCISRLETGHKQVSRTVWSHDGNRLASSGHWGGMVEIWDLQTGKCISKLEVGTNPDFIIWSFSGARLATQTSDQTTDTSSPKTEKHMHQPVCCTDTDPRINSNLPFEFDVQRSTTKIWDTNTGRCISTFESKGTISWARDDIRLALKEQTTISIWNTDTCQCIATLERGHLDPIIALEWVPDSTRIVSESEDELVIWVLPTTLKTEPSVRIQGQYSDELMGSYPLHFSWEMHHITPILRPALYILEDKISTARLRTALSFSEDGTKFASTGLRHAIKIWSTITSKCISTLQEHDIILCIAWSPDGTRLASGSKGSTVRIWNPITAHCMLLLRGHTDAVTAVLWSQDGNRLLSLSNDLTTRIWDTSSDSYTSSHSTSAIDRADGQVIFIAWSHDETRLASLSRDWTTFRDLTISIWDKHSVKPILTFKAHHLSVIGSTKHSQIFWARDGCRLASVADDTTNIWDCFTGRCISTLTHRTMNVDYVSFLDWSPSGTQIASVEKFNSRSRVRIWNLSTFTQEAQSGSGLFNGSVQPFEWSPDDAWLASTIMNMTDFPFGSSSQGTVIKIWNSASGRCLLTFELETKVSSMSWSNDSTWLRLGYLCVKVDTLLTDRRERPTATGFESSSTVSVSHDGTMQASLLEGRTIKVWDIAKDKCLHELQLEVCQWIVFDSSDSSILHTSVGTFRFGHDNHKRRHPINDSDSEESVPRQAGYGIKSDESWITFDGQDLLWLPPDFRPARPDLFVMSGNTAVIGCFLGHVLILNFFGMNPIQSLAASTSPVPCCEPAQ